MTKGFILFLNLAVVFYFASGSITGKWRLIQYKNLTTGQIENEPPEFKDRDVMTFYFQDKGNSGKFKGKTIRNDVYGEYTLMPNNKIKVFNFGGTKVGEPEWGGKFWSSIRVSSSFKISNDTLAIFSENEKKCMVFIRRI